MTSTCWASISFGTGAISINVFVAFRPLTNLGLFGNGHFWSLAVEEQFYLCWPAVVFLLGRRSLMLACVACVLGAPVFRFALVEGAVGPLANSLAPGVLAPARMDALALGGFLALAARRPEELKRLLRWAWPVAWASALVLLGLFFWRGSLSFYDDWVQTVGYTANAFLFGAILTLAVAAAPNTALHSVCTHRFLTFFGRYSYALYVFHFQIAVLLARRVSEAGGLPTVAGLEVPARIVVHAVWYLVFRDFGLVELALVREAVPQAQGAFPLRRTPRWQF